MASTSPRAARAQEFEALISERLRVELQAVQDERDRLYERISHLMELRNNMMMLQDRGSGAMKTQINLGCNFHVQARVPDTSWVYVNVGLGFHAQMTPAEAIAFSTQQEEALGKTVEALTQRAAKIKAQIKLAVAAVDEISSSLGVT